MYYMYVLCFSTWYVWLLLEKKKPCAQCFNSFIHITSKPREGKLHITLGGGADQVVSRVARLAGVHCAALCVS